jgi:hypothetical protein
MLVPSPISALASALSPSVKAQNVSSMFWMLGTPYEWVMGAPPISLAGIPRPVYHYSLPFFAGITLMLYLLATRLVKPARRWQVRWAEVLIAVILILGFVGLIAVGYISTSNRYENVRPASESTPTPQPVFLPMRVLPEQFPEAQDAAGLANQLSATWTS